MPSIIESSHSSDVASNSLSILCLHQACHLNPLRPSDVPSSLLHLFREDDRRKSSADPKSSTPNAGDRIEYSGFEFLGAPLDPAVACGIADGLLDPNTLVSNASISVFFNLIWQNVTIYCPHSLTVYALIFVMMNTSTVFFNIKLNPPFHSLSSILSSFAKSPCASFYSYSHPLFLSLSPLSFYSLLLTSSLLPSPLLFHPFLYFILLLSSPLLLSSLFLFFSNPSNSWTQLKEPLHLHIRKAAMSVRKAIHSIHKQQICLSSYMLLRRILKAIQ